MDKALEIAVRGACLGRLPDEDCEHPECGCQVPSILQRGLAALEAAGLRIVPVERLRPLEEWHEDHGDVLWWKLPVQEAPYCGQPLDTEWPGSHTHWTLLPIPEIEEITRAMAGGTDAKP